jgi:hypothetical protein
MIMEGDITQIELTMDNTTMWLSLLFHTWVKHRGIVYLEGRKAWWDGFNAIPHEKMWEMFMSDQRIKVL